MIRTATDVWRPIHFERDPSLNVEGKLAIEEGT